MGAPRRASLPDRISFIKVLKHTRRSVVRQHAETPAKIPKFLASLAEKVHRKLDNGTRRLREADRFLKRPNSLYSYRPKDRPRIPVRRVDAKVITLHTAMVQ
ncbi:hypothetical protein [Streptomyces sp. NPDC059176]|uniref:hypothetical protein n=1 Tax=Streptomyces sp. NPDC059176 TaxID=3346758 RepID=UPI0036B555CA